MEAQAPQEEDIKELFDNEESVEEADDYISEPPKDRIYNLYKDAAYILKNYAQSICFGNKEGVKKLSELLNIAKAVQNDLSISLCAQMPTEFGGEEMIPVRNAFIASYLCGKMQIKNEKRQPVLIAAYLSDVVFEFDDMPYTDKRQHPVLSSKILAGTKDARISKEVRDMVECHHLYMDGSGYPVIAKGNAIPLGAYIIHISEILGRLIDRNILYDSDNDMYAMIDGKQIVKELENYKGMFGKDLLEAVIGIISNDPVSNTRKEN